MTRMVKSLNFILGICTISMLDVSGQGGWTEEPISVKAEFDTILAYSLTYSEVLAGEAFAGLRLWDKILSIRVGTFASHTRTGLLGGGVTVDPKALAAKLGGTFDSKLPIHEIGIGVVTNPTKNWDTEFVVQATIFRFTF